MRLPKDGPIIFGYVVLNAATKASSSITRLCLTQYGTLCARFFGGLEGLRSAPAGTNLADWRKSCNKKVMMMMMEQGYHHGIRQ
jgi:hypothetical protein